MVPRPAPALDWCFTLNNPDDLSSVFAYKVGKWPITYAVHQKEMAESGTPHYQGFVIFKKKQRFTAVVKLLPKAHWEKRKGTREEARDYCMKDDTRAPGYVPVEVPTQECPA